MAQSLKRKRNDGTSSRKAQRVSSADEHDSTPQVDEENSEDEKSMLSQEEEGEEWGGVGESDQEALLDENKEHRKPSGEDIRVMKDASELFKSNSFKMQIDALLPNVRPKQKLIPPLDRFLLDLHTVLSNSPSISPRHPLEAARSLLKKGVSVPYSTPMPNEDTNWKVAFEKPSDITLVGSWANKTHVKGQDGSKYGVDLAVEMPSTLFQEKDYLNGRFFHKRSFYLAAIAAAIISDKGIGSKVSASYSSLGDDPRLTKLVLEPCGDGSVHDFTKLNARICIIPTLSANSPIPLHRLSPSHLNFRGISEDSSEADQKASPLYNSAVLTSLTPRSHLLSTHALQQTVPAFDDAVALLRVWANQRGYGEGSKMTVRGFDGKGPWWTSLLQFLIEGEEPSGVAKNKKRKPVGRGLSSYQLFRAALDFLANHDFEKSPVFIKTKDGRHRYPPSEYNSHHDAVFVDSTSTVNLLLQSDAKKTLNHLNLSSVGDPFPEVFLTDHRDSQSRFDAVIRVDLSSVKPRKLTPHRVVDSGAAANAMMSMMSSLLSRGLGDRIQAVAILHPSPSLRPLSQAHPSSPHIIHIGLLYDTRHAFRQVDHGPAADESDPSVVEQFLDFWGDKAELRRFKDGSIVQSVVWDVKTVDEKAHIPVMVVRHILHRHFGLDDTSITTWQTHFDSLLKLPESIGRYYLGSGIPMGFKGAITAFDDLVKSIKALDEQLPLTLSSASAISDCLRYTSVFSPVPLSTSLAAVLPPNARYTHPIEIILDFEKSSRWPDDLRAIQKVKLAFFERIAAALMSSLGGMKVSVVVGDTQNEFQDDSCLEMVTAEGWTFCARIHHDREATLLDRIISGKGNLPHVATKAAKDHKKGKEYRDAVQAREVYTRRFIHAPRHHRAIAKLSHHFPAFSGTVRLLKRWFASHWLLHGHVSEEVIELLCARLFVVPGWDEDADMENNPHLINPIVPGSKERGFADVMRFLTEWKWEEGVFVPIYDASASSSSSTTTTDSSTVGVWRVSTKMDEQGTMWTRNGPDHVVARRVQVLAQATWKYIQDMETTGKVVVKSMFDHPTNDYNLVLSLNKQSLTRYHHNVKADPNNLPRQGKDQNQAEGVVVRPGFDPAMAYFKDLQRVYADTFRVFYDPFGGDRIGAVWDPSLKAPRPFRVLGGFSSAPAEDPSSKDNAKSKKSKDLVALNEAAVIGELERMGTGLLNGITVHV
ncbi:U3 snoRNP protein [Marasmius crinis-equi]|uniref:U3 small nucleolar RNA-associated protein 22 n=1 Tax=Marasmius crinis-equi TaxID=585013 RepID=A0ABR3FSZ5_9AGAR